MDMENQKFYSEFGNQEVTICFKVKNRLETEEDKSVVFYIPSFICSELGYDEVSYEYDYGYDDSAKIDIIDQNFDDDDALEPDTEYSMTVKFGFLRVSGEVEWGDFGGSTEIDRERSMVVQEDTTDLKNAVNKKFQDDCEVSSITAEEPYLDEDAEIEYE